MFRSMEYEIRALLTNDEPILREILYQGLSSVGNHQPSREILQRPEFSHYARGWGRAGDTGFVAHDKKDGSVLGAVWLRKPIDKPDAPPELAFAVRPVLRLYERFGFKVAEEGPAAIVMRRQV